MSRRGSLLALVWVVAACSTGPTVPPTQSPTVQPTAASVSPSSPIPTIEPTAAAIELPNPGGTCVAASFVAVAPSISSFTFAALDTRHVAGRQDLRNIGAACDLAQPKVIGLGSATVDPVAVSVYSLGYSVCKDRMCHYEYPATTRVDAGVIVSVSFNTWWWTTAQEDRFSPVPCATTLTDVTRAVIPFATGQLEMSWETRIAEVCSADPHFGLGFVTGAPNASAPEPGVAACRASEVRLTPGASGAAAGTAYIHLALELADGRDCLIARSPSLTITDAQGKVVARATEDDIDLSPISAGRLFGYYLGWNTACGDRFTGPFTANIELPSKQTVSVPLGDFGPSCADGSYGDVFLEVDGP